MALAESRATFGNSIFRGQVWTAAGQHVEPHPIRFAAFATVPTVVVAEAGAIETAPVDQSVAEDWSAGFPTAVVTRYSAHPSEDSGVRQVC